MSYQRDADTINMGLRCDASIAEERTGGWTTMTKWYEACMLQVNFFEWISSLEWYWNLLIIFIIGAILIFIIHFLPRGGGR